MRGDSVRKGSMNKPIHSYLHTYYEDVEELYRKNTTAWESEYVVSLAVSSVVKQY